MRGGRGFLGRGGCEDRRGGVVAGGCSFLRIRSLASVIEAS